MAGEQQDVISIVRKIGTEFADVKDEELKQWQEICAPAISAAKFGKEYNLALALLICHSMKLAGLGNTSLGSIADTARFASVSEGSTSISFASTTADAGAAFRVPPYQLRLAVFDGQEPPLHLYQHSQIRGASWAKN